MIQDIKWKLNMHPSPTTQFPSKGEGNRERERESEGKRERERDIDCRLRMNSHPIPEIQTQVEREIEGKEWTTKMVSELSKTLLDLKETLIGTQVSPCVSKP